MSTLYNTTMKIEQLSEYIYKRLNLEQFESADSSLNGLQFGSPAKEVKRVACGVDASLSTFVKAAKWGADALFVHHGLFWGKPIAITDLHYRRIECLFKNDMALIAAHLPLDAHPQLGNNATMARLLDLVEVSPFGLYNGHYIGYRGLFKESSSIEEIVKLLNLGEESGLRVLPFGKKEIKSVGIISGGAAFDVLEAIDLKLDAYITGESSHTMFSYCQEAKMNMICGGHYATEVFGVQMVAKDLKENLGLETTFIDNPTAL